MERASNRPTTLIQQTPLYKLLNVIRLAHRNNDRRKCQRASPFSFHDRYRTWFTMAVPAGYPTAFNSWRQLDNTQLVIDGTSYQKQLMTAWPCDAHLALHRRGATFRRKMEAQ